MARLKLSRVRVACWLASPGLPPGRPEQILSFCLWPCCRRELATNLRGSDNRALQQCLGADPLIAPFQILSLRRKLPIPSCYYGRRSLQPLALSFIAETGQTKSSACAASINSPAPPLFPFRPSCHCTSCASNISPSTPSSLFQLPPFTMIGRLFATCLLMAAYIMVSHGRRSKFRGKPSFF